MSGRCCCCCCWRLAVCLLLAPFLFRAIMTGNDGSFSISQTTGSVTRGKRNIDRERQSSYTLIVTATNKANTKYSTTAKAFITVRDQNDNPPIFQPSNKYASTTLALHFSLNVVCSTSFFSCLWGHVQERPLTHKRLSGYFRLPVKHRVRRQSAHCYTM